MASLKKRGIRKYKGKGFSLTVTPEGRRRIVEYRKRKKKSLLKETPVMRRTVLSKGRSGMVGDIRFKEVAPERVAEERREMFDATRQRRVSKAVPMPLFRLEIGKRIIYGKREKPGMVPLKERLSKQGRYFRGFPEMSKTQLQQLLRLIRREGMKLAENGLLPGDFSIRNILVSDPLKRKRLAITFIDTSTALPVRLTVARALERAGLKTLDKFLAEEMQRRKISKPVNELSDKEAAKLTVAISKNLNAYYRKLPKEARIKLQKVIVEGAIKEIEGFIYEEEMMFYEQP